MPEPPRSAPARSRRGGARRRQEAHSLTAAGPKPSTSHPHQGEFDIRCEWGLHGVQTLAPVSDVVVIVDVLSFTTCVDIAAANGAVVFPYRFRDDTAGDYARKRNALLASPRHGVGLRGDSGPRDAAAGTYSLSPAGLLDIPAGTRLVRPPPTAPRCPSPPAGLRPSPAACATAGRSPHAWAASDAGWRSFRPGNAGRTAASGPPWRTWSAPARSSAGSAAASPRKHAPPRRSSRAAVATSGASSRRAPPARS